MKRILRYIGMGLGVIIVLIIVLFVVIQILSNQRINEEFDVEVAAITIPDDEEAVARGEYLANVLPGCTDCHGEGFRGDVVIDVGFPFGELHAPNLTTGEGGEGSEYTDGDFVRAIRHGIGKDGKALLLMPSEEFFNMSDEDLGAVIAYIRSLPPADHEVPEPSLGPIFRGIMAFSDTAFRAAAEIDHTAPRPAPIEQGPTAVYGEYLTSISCIGCHGENLSGGSIPGTPSDFPEAANLTNLPRLGDYTEDNFIAAIRTGVRHDGEVMDSDYMPWQTYAGLIEDDVTALWAYIQTLPEAETGSGY